ncbi:MAG TPA: methyltransferase [Xanthobacteraceae bacterium]|jgi:tRNA1(Val) A37 N6-methylase TrmN6
MGAEPQSQALTDDAVLGGRLRLLQPARGHRVGHDAILLAASTAAVAGDVAIDLGAGVGAAGLALASRVPGVVVRLVELDAELAGLAAQNATRNGLASRVTAHALDVTAPPAQFAAAGLGPATADHVLMNPPFNDAERAQASPDARRRVAHVAAPGALASWIGTAACLLRRDGRLTSVYRADGLSALLAILETAFGAVTLQPVHPKPAAAAIRVLARAVKGSRAPLVVLPGLVLAGADGRPTPEAEAVLRGGGALPLAHG